MLDKFISISKAIDGIEASINDESLTESQRAGLFLDYKEYLDKAAVRMEQIIMSGDSVMAKKAQEIAQKVASVLEQAGSYMAVQVPETKDNGPIPAVNQMEVKSGITKAENVEGVPAENEEEPFVFLDQHGKPYLYDGHPSGLAAHVNYTLADDIQRGYVPRVYRCEPIQSKKSVYYSFGEK